MVIRSSQKFEQNPFFENVELSREFSFSHKGTIDISFTEIKWKDKIYVEKTNLVGVSDKWVVESVMEEVKVLWDISLLLPRNQNHL
ncbi:NAP1-related protein 2-like isoform X2 [Papaver somniferum]|uniref:NAP1-related protein 2-like isoform X2 n=1 Tax=Papaver somniferum TaxID=3469 RepID=UPI000E6FB67A|nr:NAP1-related protein 2-like isoform X2 [Papaver somniferum]